MLVGLSAWATITLVDPETQQAYDMYKAGKTEEAISLFMVKAYEGVPTAQYNLAVIYSKHKGNDLYQKEVEFWLKQSAESGDSDAQFNFAMLNYNNQDDESRLENTVKWLTRSAKNNNLKAQYNLGYLAFSNLEISISRQKGVDWLQKAAIGRNDRARKLISLLQENKSEGVPKLYSIDLQLKSVPREKIYVIKNEDTNLYAFPVVRQKPLRVLNRDTVVNISERRNGWLGVHVEGGFPSWVAKEQLLVKGQTATIVNLEASLFVEPVINQDVFKIGVVNTGQTLQILGRQDNWVKVSTPDHFLAWVKESDVEELTIDNFEPAGDLSVVIDNSDSESVQPATQEEFDSSKLKKLPLDDDDDNDLDAGNVVKLVQWYPVFSESSRSSSLLGIVSGGKEVSVLETVDEFSRVSWSGGVEAWIFGKFLEVADTNGRVTGDSIRVRVLPSMGKSAAVVGHLNKDQIVRVLAEENGWYRVEIGNSNTGWIENL